MVKYNISRDEIADAMKSEFGFNRKLCLDIVNDIVDIIIEGLQLDKKVKIENNSLDTMKVISNNGNVLIVSYEKDKLNIDKIIDYLNKKNVKILDLSTDDGDLEDVFINLTNM